MTEAQETEDEFNERIMRDWMWECRTCRFWHVDHRGVTISGICAKDDSPLHGQETNSSGNCPKWDPFDEDLCFKIMEEDEAARKRPPRGVAPDPNFRGR